MTQSEFEGFTLSTTLQFSIRQKQQRLITEASGKDQKPSKHWTILINICQSVTLCVLLFIVEAKQERTDSKKGLKMLFPLSVCAKSASGQSHFAAFKASSWKQKLRGTRWRMFSSEKSMFFLQKLFLLSSILRMFCHILSVSSRYPLEVERFCRRRFSMDPI